MTSSIDKTQESILNQKSTRVFKKSHKLDNVCYDIRGPIMQTAKQMEEAGHKIIKLNIGNMAPFGFDSPEEIRQDMILNLPHAAAYSDSKGIFSARKAIMHYTQQKGILGVKLDDIIVGNGVSELITMTMNGLLNPNDEVLVPSPDYPLWTAGVTLSTGKAVHYLCDEENSWYPNIADMEAKISDKTKAIVVINPNNPTGSLYPEKILLAIIDLARKYGLIIFADEIYDKTLYEGKHISIASLASDIPFITFNGLSKNYRSCGYRAGWLVLSGNLDGITDYIEGLNMLASMRLCANVPGQFGIQTALGGYQSIDELTAPNGRLRRQRDLAYNLITSIKGVTCVKPSAALYLFAKLDPVIYPIKNDQEFIHQFLVQEKVLLVQGSGFNWHNTDHVRIVFLPHEDELREAISRFARFLDNYSKNPCA
jgi:alanine-synthesizing transaminase